MSLIFLGCAVAFLAHANGANDNFKGVASLHGSRVLRYSSALLLATVATVAGSLYSIVVATALISTFSGKGLVPDAIAASGQFPLAVALGAGATVILATSRGFPVSTTHALTGAIVGGGLAAAGTNLKLSVLQQQFLLPLFVSPLLAVTFGAGLYLALHLLRLRLGITNEGCVCTGTEDGVTALQQPNSLLVAQALPVISISASTRERCSERYSGTFVRISAQPLTHVVHILSAGAVSFARGLNDTPKIAALLLAGVALGVQSSSALVALAMALGGLLNARRVADTMSHRITGMNQGQGLSANLATSLLVIAASRFGLPVSTTHVSVGALFGIGLATRQAHLTVVGEIVLAWVVTLPCAALLGAIAYWLTGLLP